MMNKKLVLHGVTIIALLVFMFFAVGSDATTASAVSSGYSNAYSSSSDTGLMYTFYNYSSYTVTISDDTGSATIAAGSSASARFNKNASIGSVNYSPYDKVSASQSGTTFTFRDR